MATKSQTITNVTNHNQLSAEDKTFYERTLLQRLLPSLMFYNDAEKKIEQLHNYMEKDRARLYYIWESQIVAMMWVHPIDIYHQQRIYMHAIEVNKSVRGKGYGSALYYNLENDYPDTIIYTHVDYSNIISRKLHEKVGFVPEKYQFEKNIAEFS